VPFTYEHPRPAVTADVVLFTLRARDLAVLLVRRARAPFKNAWALPGGFVDRNEPLERAAARELQEETGVTGALLEQLAAFGDPGRDPRGHTVSIAYFSMVAAETHPLVAGDDASEVAWFPLGDLPITQPQPPPSTPAPRPRKRARGHERLVTLAFDHARIIELARWRLQQRLLDPTRASRFEIAPPQFTLTEVQHVFEAVLGRALDKRNFRARLLGRGLVEEVSEHRRGRHRPAQLYRWRPKD
jgi:8-oxo-dGTP diphosphatase